MHRVRVPVRRRFAVLAAAFLVVGTGLFVQVALAAAPSNFVDVNNHQERWSGTGTSDWGNGSATTPAACSHPTTVNGVQTCPGTNGLFDGGVFKALWQSKTPSQFRSYIRYYMSDHRPLWAEFQL